MKGLLSASYKEEGQGGGAMRGERGPGTNQSLIRACCPCQLTSKVAPHFFFCILTEPQLLSGKKMSLDEPCLEINPEVICEKQMYPWRKSVAFGSLDHVYLIPSALLSPQRCSLLEPACSAVCRALQRILYNIKAGTFTSSRNTNSWQLCFQLISFHSPHPWLVFQRLLPGA